MVSKVPLEGYVSQRIGCQKSDAWDWQTRNSGWNFQWMFFA